MTERNTYTIDANGKKLGRVATEVSSVLSGKNTTTYVPHTTPSIEVRVINAAKLDISPKKMYNYI